MCMFVLDSCVLPWGCSRGWQAWKEHGVENQAGQESTLAPTQICNENMGKSSLGPVCPCLHGIACKKQVPSTTPVRILHCNTFGEENTTVSKLHLRLYLTSCVKMLNSHTFSASTTHKLFMG